MTLYDKDGKEYNVPFAIDVAEWVASGNYFLDKPEKKTTKKLTEKE